MNPFFKDDPVFSALKKLNANILQIPDGRIVPLGVIEQPLLGPAKYRTTLPQILLDKNTFDLDSDDLETKFMAGISGERTHSLSAHAGLNLLSGLLTSKPAGASGSGLQSVLADISSVTYTFDRLEVIWMDNGLLAQALENQFIRNNALTSTFFQIPASKLLLIDSVIVCKEFSIHLSESTDDDYTANIDAIAKKIAGLSADYSIVSNDRSSISFSGKTGLPIAFTCLHLRLDGNGKIVGMPPRLKRISKIYGYGHEGELEKSYIEPKGQDGFLHVDFK